MYGVDNATESGRAIKVLPRAKVVGYSQMASAANKEDGLLYEVAVMKKLHHKNVVQLYECIDDPEDDAVYLVMQFVDGGPMLKFDRDGTCAPMPLSTVQKNMRQLASAVHYIHRRGVVHRDIKPDNILVDVHGNLFLSDFGVSEMVEKAPERVRSQHGTPLFLSPEVLNGAEAGPPADMWAVGITLYAMVYGQLPFYAETYGAMQQSVLRGRITFPPSSPDKLKWRKIIEKLLTQDPSQRMTAAQLHKSPTVFGSAPPSPLAGGEEETIDNVRATVTPQELAAAVKTKRGKFEDGQRRLSKGKDVVDVTHSTENTSVRSREESQS